MPAVLAQRLSGGAGNTSPAASLGGAKSTQAAAIIDDNVPGELWRDITPAEAAAGLVIYRCWYIENSGDQPATSVVLWVDDEGSGVAGVNIDVALSVAAIGADTAVTIANESTAPAGGEVPAGFARPATKGAGIAVGTIPAGSKKAVWERLTVTAGAAAGTDVPSVTVEGDTAP